MYKNLRLGFESKNILVQGNSANSCTNVQPIYKNI